MKVIEPGVSNMEKILTLQVHTSKGPINLISMYAAILSTSQERKDEFEEEFPARSSHCCLVILMQEWVLIMTAGFLLSMDMAR